MTDCHILRSPMEKSFSCGHTFHLACIAPSVDICPLCRLYIKTNIRMKATTAKKAIFCTEEIDEPDDDDVAEGEDTVQISSEIPDMSEHEANEIREQLVNTIITWASDTHVTDHEYIRPNSQNTHVLLDHDYTTRLDQLPLPQRDSHDSISPAPQRVTARWVEVPHSFRYAVRGFDVIQRRILMENIRDGHLHPNLPPTTHTRRVSLEACFGDRMAT